MRSVRFFSLAILLVSMCSVTGCGNSGSNASNGSGSAAATATSSAATKKQLVILVDRSDSTEKAQGLRDMYKRLAIGTVRGENYKKENKWAGLQIWGFPMGPYIDPVYTLKKEGSKDPQIASFNGDVMRAINTQIAGFKKTDIETDYIVPLHKLAEFCQESAEPVTAVILTDGGDQGVSDKDYEKVIEAAGLLASKDKLSEVLIGPVVANSGNVGKIQRLFGPLGDKLVVITDADIRTKLSTWQSKL